MRPNNKRPLNEPPAAQRMHIDGYSLNQPTTDRPFIQAKGCYEQTYQNYRNGGDGGRLGRPGIGRRL
jgi:hypothetical protein